MNAVSFLRDIKLAQQPQIMLNGELCTAKSIEIHQCIQTGATAQIEVGADVTVAIGQTLRIVHAQDLFSGTVIKINRQRTPSGLIVSIFAKVACALDTIQSCTFANEKPMSILKTLLPSLQSQGPAGEVHDQYTVLHEPLMAPAVRLALLTGRVLLVNSRGVCAVDPTRPGSIKQLDSFGLLNEEQSAIPTLLLRSANGDKLGEVFEYHLAGDTAGPTIPLFLSEAISAGELADAAKAIHACESQGNFELVSGQDIIHLEPGDWIQVKGSPPRLITGRVLHWMESTGWHCRMSGGYDWQSLTKRTQNGIELAKVEGVTKSGMLKVKLPYHGLSMNVWMAAQRSNASELIMSLPAVGDVGLIAWHGSPEWAQFVNCTTAKGRISPEVFQQSLHIIDTPNQKISLHADGTQQITAKQISWKLQKEFEAVLTKFRLKKA